MTLPPAFDCLIVGGGPAGLTAALYLARFGRRFLLVDSGASRAAWIPATHNLPFFAGGITGADLLQRQRDSLLAHKVEPLRGLITGLRRQDGGFRAVLRPQQGADHVVAARHVLLASGARDIEPVLPRLAEAVQRGLLRYCPICDGYEARGQSIAVVGIGAHGLEEAVFLARTYSSRVTLMTLGTPLEEAARVRLAEHGIALAEQPVADLAMQDGGIEAVTADGTRHRFDTIYAALGLHVRSELARALGAERDAGGALVVDVHNRTTVPGLYAAGDVAHGLNQIVVAMGHAAQAATDIHNRCSRMAEEA